MSSKSTVQQGKGVRYIRTWHQSCDHGQILLCLVIPPVKTPLYSVDMNIN